MARGTYTVPCTNVTLANQPVTLVFVNPGTDATLEFVRGWCSQAANATSAQQRVQINSQVTAFPTLTTITPQKTTELDAVSTIVGGTAGAAGTSGINASAEGAGAKTILMPDAFNVLNGAVNATWISQLGAYPRDGYMDSRLWIGTSIFFAGWIVNLRSDNTLIALREPGESGYRIPQGGLFRWVSSPNYLGEIVVWFGWAIASWSWGGLAFAVYTFANLAPRARSTHAWYQETFPDYPKKRRALIPFIA